jgi:hypothetical protein
VKIREVRGKNSSLSFVFSETRAPAFPLCVLRV